MRLSNNPEIFLNERTSPEVVVAAAQFLDPGLFESNSYSRSYAFLSEYVPFETPLPIDEFNDYYYQAVGGATFKMDEMVRRSLPRIIHTANRVWANYSGDMSAYDVFATVYTEFQYTFFELVVNGGTHESPYGSHFNALAHRLNIEFDYVDDGYCSIPNQEREYIDMDGLKFLYSSLLDSDPEDPQLAVIYDAIKSSPVGFQDFAILYLSSIVGMSGREIGIFLKRGGSAAINKRLNTIKEKIFRSWGSCRRQLY